jgi:hypothetical protein
VDLAGARMATSSYIDAQASPGPPKEEAMDGIIGDRILRCSDGHLFVSTEGRRLLGSVHFGPKRLIRCPVDGRWRLAGNVDSRDLTEQQLSQARQYRT